MIYGIIFNTYDNIKSMISILMGIVELVVSSLKYLKTEKYKLLN